MEFVCYARDKIADFRYAGEIGLEGEGTATELLDFTNDFAGFGLRFAVMDGDIGAFVGKTKGNGVAKALPCPGDEGDAAVEVGFGGHGRGTLGKGSTSEFTVHSRQFEAKRKSPQRAQGKSEREKHNHEGTLKETLKLRARGCGA